MRPLSEATSRITGKSFNRKYVSLGRIVNSWRDIVGDNFADKAQPVKINYRKKKGKEKPEASLDIATSSAEATALHYQKDLILERINQIFGERWITSIRFVQIPANAKTLKRRKTQTPLSVEEKDTLSNILINVADEDIKSRLENLGQAVITEDKS